MTSPWVVLAVVGLLGALVLCGSPPVRAWLAHRRATVLVISEFAPYLEILVATLRRAGYRPRGVHPSGTLELLRRGRYHIVVSGLVLPYLTGTELLAAIRGLSPRPEVVFLSGDPASHSAEEAIRRGAFAVVDKRSMGDLRRAMHGAFAQAFSVRRPTRQAVPVPVRVQ